MPEPLGENIPEYVVRFSLLSAESNIPIRVHPPEEPEEFSPNVIDFGTNPDNICPLIFTNKKIWV